ncbi:MAG: prepilin-type N-terminal cleavage/methylation domain-containing protein [Planctomycetota bacterium]
MTASRPADHRAVRRGFTLTELLIVILVITILISILVPALGGARESARKVQTTGLLNNVSQASQQFKIDNQGRAPGYFTPAQMGSSQNGGNSIGANPGSMGVMSAMENILLDLSGQGAIWQNATPPDPLEWLPVGPFSDTTADGVINVNPGLIGAGDEAYFTPPNEFYTAQVYGRQFEPNDGQFGHSAASDEDPQLLDLVDSWGAPILAWVADTDRFGSIQVDAQGIPTNFARQNSDQGEALFYWNSNAAFLRPQEFGPELVDMQTVLGTANASDRISLLGVGTMNGAGSNEEETFNRIFAALYGSPAYPDEASIDPASSNIFEEAFPVRPRGELILQSSGPDNIPFAANNNETSRIGRFVSGDAWDQNTLRYGLLFAPRGGARYTNEDTGQLEVRDFVVDGFDDILVTD